MKAFIIYQKESRESKQAAQVTGRSVKKFCSDVHLYGLNATTPDTIEDGLKEINQPNLEYTYPKDNEVKYHQEADVKLRLTGYVANSIPVKLSCTISHARLWNMCVKYNEEIMILEHDAVFVKDFKPFNWEGGALGLNDPRGATRRANILYDEIKERSFHKAIDLPWIDVSTTPQGLAGNSAYIIKPDFAAKLLEKLDEVGAWPNDALMCKQLFPKELKVIYPFYTRVQGIRSTTT
tara:strand:+ start:921 stop:1628 length:708 start_codon:yes stop_codon:yes gene_type:complete